jgi:hypothetical protein
MLHVTRATEKNSITAEYPQHLVFINPELGASLSGPRLEHPKSREIRKSGDGQVVAMSSAASAARAATTASNEKQQRGLQCD